MRRENWNMRFSRRLARRLAPCAFLAAGWASAALADSPPAATAAAASKPVAAALPQFEGHAVRARPLPPLPMPAHPIMNNRGYAGAHGDGYNSHALPEAGPLGKRLQVRAYHVPTAPSLCSTQAFDGKGRIVTVCVGRRTPSKLLLLDPADLHPLAEQELPPMAGFYFRTDQQGRVVIPSGDRSIRIYEVDESSGKPVWSLVHHYDVSSAIPEAQRGPAAIPMDVVADWQGNWWFSIIGPAAVGYVTPSGEVHSHLLAGEKIENGLAVDADGIYFASNKAIYGTRAGAQGVDVFFRHAYDIGQAEISLTSGSGTTPTLFGNRLIAFGDNADPRPNVVVYRLDDVPDDKRLVCKIPVFQPHRSVLENSLIGYDHSLVVWNNAGFSVEGDSSKSEPGIIRIDVKKDLSGCAVVWENDGIRSGTGAKLSLGSGLIYFHELLMGTDDAWYVTAVDFRTGTLAWRKYVGSGKDWDNAMLTMSIGPDGLLTSGLHAGILGVRDGP